METQNNNIRQNNTLEKKAKKLRRQRTRQIVASIFGIIILDHSCMWNSKDIHDLP